MEFDIIFGNAARAALGPEAVILALAAVGLNVHFGFTGLFNFGQVGFMLLGAYRHQASRSPCSAGLCGSGSQSAWRLTVALALALGVPTLRLQAVLFAIVTLAAAEILRADHRLDRRNRPHRRPLSISFDASAFYDLNPYADGPQDRYGTGTFVFTGQQMWVITVGWTTRGTGRPGGVPDRSQSVGTGGQVHPRGRERRSQSWQGCVLLQDAGAGHRRRDRGSCRVVDAIKTSGADPNGFRPQVTFFTYTALLLGGSATYTGPVIGAILFWFLREWIESFLRQLAAESWLPNPIADFLAGTEGVISVGLVVGTHPARSVPTPGNSRQAVQKC